MLWMNLASKAVLKGCRIFEKRLGWPQIASRQSPVDFDNWLRGPLQGWIKHVIYDLHPITNSVLRPDFCFEIYNRIMAGEGKSRLLGAIASLRGFGDALAQACEKVVPNSKQPVEVTRNALS